MEVASLDSSPYLLDRKKDVVVAVDVVPIFLILFSLVWPCILLGVLLIIGKSSTARIRALDLTLLETAQKAAEAAQKAALAAHVAAGAAHLLAEQKTTAEQQKRGDAS